MTSAQALGWFRCEEENARRIGDFDLADVCREAADAVALPCALRYSMVMGRMERRLRELEPLAIAELEGTCPPY
jgi:hypothetical protein